jgi:exodeoxyribonuclease VII small subunit
MKDMSFEKALAELEAVVDKLEAGDTTLDQSLSLFEKGVQLAKYLRRELEKAEKKIEILLKDKDGEIQAKAFGLSEAGNSGEEDREEGSGGEEDLPF